MTILMSDPRVAAVPVASFGPTRARVSSGLAERPEWWHWSYGDRYWALLTVAAHAAVPTA